MTHEKSFRDVLLEMEAAGYLSPPQARPSRRTRISEAATTEGGGSNSSKKTPSEIKLSKDGDFKPFTVSDESHSNLRVLVQAFLDSDRVPIPGPDGTGPLTTIEKDKGETVPRLKKKTLYLVGGAVRDHLRGKTPKDYDLATDATPDEIRLILRHAGFTEVKPQTGKHAPKDRRYDKHPEGANKSKTYYAKGWDRAGREFVMGVKVSGQEFEVATFRKDSKGGDGRTPDRMEFAGLEDDAARRDFTINSMYIPLSNANGDNNRVIDPHGGAHHLRSGEVKFVGDPKERLEEDQLRALRYVRFLARRGMNGQVPPDYKEAIQTIRELPSVSKERVREEFVKALEHPETDTRMLLKVYKDLGLLDTVFPKMQFKLDKDDDFTDKKDRRLVTAHLLRHNHQDDVKQMLSGTHWPNNEVNDIMHLLKMSKWGQSYKSNPDEFYKGFYDVKSGQNRTSLVPSLIRSWAKMTGMDEEAIEHYLAHELSTRGMISQPNGVRTVNPEIVQRLGRVPQGEDFGTAIRDIESDKFRQRFAHKK
jgi:tRNA nucleotidyltransferase/poly(A) polymerase